MEEYEFRLQQFAFKYAGIKAHNKTDSKYRLGINKMADWTQEEYEKILTHKHELNAGASNPMPVP